MLLAPPLHPHPHPHPRLPRINHLRNFQVWFTANNRLKIPISFVIETSHCGAAGGTIFPMGVTQGSSWNIELTHAIAGAIAKEARAWGGDRGLSPEINVCTDPRFGRTEENFGEDPRHVEAFAAAAVTGLQGGSTSPTTYLPDNEHVVCEAKHCCACASHRYGCSTVVLRFIDSCERDGYHS